MAISTKDLRRSSEDLSSGLPELLADAHRLAANFIAGEHGRKRAGSGDEFWQYRHATETDAAKSIDWRRSGRAQDQFFVRELEWKAAQSVSIWADRTSSMSFSSSANVPTKALRAAQICIAIAILLLKAGERVGLSEGSVPIKSGRAQIEALALDFATRQNLETSNLLNVSGPKNSQCLFVSDFLASLDEVKMAVPTMGDLGIKGVLLQVLDPAEVSFPFEGRTEFVSTSGAARFETQRASGLRADYQDRLKQRQADLNEIAQKTGWSFITHRTDQSAMVALRQIYQLIEAKRG